MEKITHLKMCRQWLRKVVTYRRNLIRLNKGKHCSANMVRTMAEVDYRIKDIDSFDRMMSWIKQKGVQYNLTELVPSNKPTWKVELEHLVFEGNILQGTVARQTELSF